MNTARYDHMPREDLIHIIDCLEQLTKTLNKKLKIEQNVSESLSNTLSFYDKDRL